MFKSKFKLLVVLFCIGSMHVSGASLPSGTSSGYDTYNSDAHNEGYDTNSSTDPMMQRVLTGWGPIADGTDGWVLTDQTPVEPFQWWTNTLTSAQNGDTLVFTDGDSISLWTSIDYPDYLEYVMIYDNGNDNPLGSVEYFQWTVPIGDATFPLLLVVCIYGSYKIRKKKKALS